MEKTVTINRFRITFIKLFNNFLTSSKIRSRFPAVVSAWIALPTNEILFFFSVFSSADYFVNLENTHGLLFSKTYFRYFFAYKCVLSKSCLKNFKTKPLKAHQGNQYALCHIPQQLRSFIDSTLWWECFRKVVIKAGQNNTMREAKI